MGIINLIKWKLQYNQDFRAMNSFTTIQDLYDYAIKKNNHLFIQDIVEKQAPNDNLRRTGKDDYIESLKYLNLDMSNKTVLELGPGWGDFLDLAKERGANTEFVDYHPYYFTHCRLKGHKGYRNDYFSNKSFKTYQQIHMILFYLKDI